RRSRRALLLPGGRVRHHRRPEAVVARRARDHRCQPRVRTAGPARGASRRGLVARRRQALGRSRRRRAPRRGDRGEQVIVERFTLERRQDDRGWFAELARASRIPKPIRQANLSWSRKGMIRGLHYHERGQDDVFVCLQGMVRVVVLDRESGDVFTSDIGDENPVAIYVPGIHAHGCEALTDSLFAYRVTEEYDPDDPDEHGVPWDDERVRHLWSTTSPILSARDASS